MSPAHAPTAPTAPTAPILEMRQIRKTFGSVVALDRVNLRLQRGEIHAIVGENGAGKSTLMKVLSGVYPAGDYEGEIRLEGQLQAFSGVRDSERQGIIIIHQELALVPLLSIAENLFLGHELSRWGVIDPLRSHDRARELLQRVGLDEDTSIPVGRLGVGKQQLVEIAKALGKQVRVLILDEPTASLNETDSQALLDLLLALKAQGVTCILISHKLNEIERVADAITVLRDGVTVATLDCHAAPPSQDLIIRHMVGREMTERYPRRQPRPGEPLFELTDWHVNHPLQRQREVVRGVSLSVRRGEIVGIAGLMGAGRTELAMSVFGRSWGHRPRGTVRMQGHEVDVSTVHKAIAAGIAYVTEDRKALGLVLDQSITRNTTLAHLLGVSRRGVLHEGREHRIAHDYRKSLQTRCATVNQAVGTLSGGNQQKVVLAKWLFANPQLLILDEPTRGIDVGAKFEIYTLMARLAEEGRGVLMISSELPELLGMCDRIYVMDQGRFVAELSAAEASQERILRAIVVGRDEAAHPGEALAAQASVAVAA